jgi:hypothetical protein
MLTPWVKPVTAGKNTANSTHSDGPSGRAARFDSNRLVSHLSKPPMKKAASAMMVRTMITYWKRVAQSDPFQARPRSRITAVPAISRTAAGWFHGVIAATASAKPMQ